MDFLTRQYRPDSCSSQEHRLCNAFNIPNPLNLPSALSNTFDSLSETAKNSYRQLRSVIGGVADNVLNVWRLDPRPESVKNGQLATIAEFSRTAPPALQRILEEQFRLRALPTLDEILVLFSQEQWLNFFAAPNNFSVISEADALTNPNSGIPLRASTIREGQRGIFQGLNEKQRELFYYEYVNGLIPVAVRDTPTFTQYFGAPNAPKTERAKIMRQNHVVIDVAMRLMTGLLAPNPDPSTRQTDISYQIAHESLMHQYWREGTRYLKEDGRRVPFDLTFAPQPDNSILNTGKGLKPQFLLDMERATGGEMFMPRVEDVASNLGPSILKGALNPDMGIMEPEDVPVLQKWIAQRSADRMMNRHRAAPEVRAYTNVIKNQNARESQTLQQSFSNLGGFEKFALLGLAVMALTNKTVRNIGVGLGALYFGQKLLLNQKDPINDVWMPMIRAPFKKLSDVTREPFKHFGIEFDQQQYTDEEMQKRIGIMDSFLSERARQELGTSLTGFTLLADMKLTDLAQYFAISDDASLATVQYEDPNFKKQIKQKLKQHGLSGTAAEQFFGGADPEVINDPAMQKQLGVTNINKHLKESGQGLGTVFYMLAVREPKNKRAMRMIEYFRSFMGNGSYQDLPIGEHYAEILDDDGVKRRMLVNPRELYVHLVREGGQLASGNEMSLLEFVSSELGNNPAPIHVPSYTSTSASVSTPTSIFGPGPNNGPLPQANTLVSPGNTPSPQTNTLVSPNNTSSPQTNTLVSPNNTSSPQANTQVSPNNTLTPQANTLVSPNNTLTPQANTLVSPNNTSSPQANTQVSPNNILSPQTNTTVLPNNSPLYQPNTSASPNNTLAPQSNTQTPINNASSASPDSTLNPNNTLPSQATTPTPANNAGVPNSSSTILPGNAPSAI